MKKKGTKKMFGKTYNNFVKKEETEIEAGKYSSSVREVEKLTLQKFIRKKQRK